MRNEKLEAVLREIQIDLFAQVNEVLDEFKFSSPERLSLVLTLGAIFSASAIRSMPEGERERYTAKTLEMINKLVSMPLAEPKEELMQ